MESMDPRRNIDGWAEQKGELERALREAKIFWPRSQGCNMVQWNAMGTYPLVN